MKKILVLGGTGALGTYLVPELLQQGYVVDVVSLDDRHSENSCLQYIKNDAKDKKFLAEQLKCGYDGIVDFLNYFSLEEFKEYYPMFLENTSHYIFTSSYRVYADSCNPITEDSPRLLDVSQDETFLQSGDYAIYKAQEENILRATGKKNFTILRPTITYSKRRFQLTILEAHHFIPRMKNGQKIVLPAPAMEVTGTLSWAGDFGKMVARLILNPYAMGETYTVGTAESHTWREIAEIYARIGGLQYVMATTDEFLSIVDPGNPHTRRQLEYDRYFNRTIDNRKILNATGYKQSDLMPLEKGLKMELDGLNFSDIWQATEIYKRMDYFLNGGK